MKIPSFDFLRMVSKVEPPRVGLITLPPFLFPLSLVKLKIPPKAGEKKTKRGS